MFGDESREGGRVSWTGGLAHSEEAGMISHTRKFDLSNREQMMEFGRTRQDRGNLPNITWYTLSLLVR